MKKINIIIIILLIIPFQLKAQRQQVIEPTNLECWYSLVVIRDTIDRSLKIDDTMILKIGKTHSLFYSYYTFYNDSLRTDPVGKQIYNPQIQISVVSGTKRSIFRQKNKTKRSKKKAAHNTYKAGAKG